jgi:hypothetical protein
MRVLLLGGFRGFTGAICKKAIKLIGDSRELEEKNNLPDRVQPTSTTCEVLYHDGTNAAAAI